MLTHQFPNHVAFIESPLARLQRRNRTRIVLASPLNRKIKNNIKPSPKKKKELPQNFPADPSNEQFAKGNGLDLDQELAIFSCLHGSLGNRRLNWQAVFRRHLITQPPTMGVSTSPIGFLGRSG